MMVWGVWHGGASYAPGDMQDVEVFASMAEAEQKFRDRREYGGIVPQYFEYVFKDDERVLTPVVGGDSELWLITPDSTLSTEIGPDPWRIIKFGPRGGVRSEEV